VGGDGGVFRRVGLVGLAILNGKRSYEGRGGGRGEKRKRAAKTERDTVGRQTEAEAETDRQTDGKSVVECAFAGCDCHQPGSGWAVFAL
jgi:hypothetical protein